MIHWMYRRATLFFWNEEFWLPPGYKWNDFDTSGNSFPNFWDLWTYPFIIAACLIFLHYFTIKIIFMPLAQYLGIQCTVVRPPVYNKTLDECYRYYGFRTPENIRKEICVKLGWQQREVDRWIRNKKASLRQTKGEKFSHASYQFTFHNFYNIYGIIILWNKEWLWDISLCYKDYPNFIVTNDIWWYYIIALGSLWAALIRQIFLRPKRKDSVIDYVHHVFTISLLVVSWSVNLVRAGTLVLLLHHWNDGFILGTKMASYANKDKLSGIFISISVISWFITRLILYPFWFIHSSLYEGPKYGFMPAAYILYGCLVVIAFLNLIWFGMLIKSIYSKVMTGKIEDVRSSGENSYDEVNDREKEE